MTWCAKCTGRTARHPCLFGDLRGCIPKNVLETAEMGDHCFVQKVHLIAHAPFQTSQWCHTHHRCCPLFGPETAAQWETAGLPCPDHSKAGKHLAEEGPTSSVFICHAKRHIEKKTPMILIENVQEGLWCLVLPPFKFSSSNLN